MSAIIKQPVMDMTMKPRQDDAMSIIERLASDSSFDADKLAKIIELHERAEDRAAKGQFHMAMAQAQSQMRPVAADASNPQTRSRYASYAAIDKALRPIYTAHGFGLSFNSGESPLAEHLRLICVVSHTSGHSHEYHLDMPADGKGAKGGDVMTKTHAAGAAVSYGMRYLLKMIFNVAVGEDDRDGNEPAQVSDPAGFADWFADMQATADDGMDALTAAWKQSSDVFRRHVTRHYQPEWEATKRKAGKVAK